jgi:hypothetical protein
VTCGENGMVAKMVAANTNPTIEHAFMFLFSLLRWAREWRSPAASTNLPVPARLYQLKLAIRQMAPITAMNAAVSRASRMGKAGIGAPEIVPACWRPSSFPEPSYQSFG